MLVALGENDVKTVEDLAGCATDDLVGYTEGRGAEAVRQAASSTASSVSRQEAEAMIIAARVKAGWIEAPAEEPAEDGSRGRGDRGAAELSLRPAATGRPGRMSPQDTLLLAAAVFVVLVVLWFSINGARQRGLSEAVGCEGARRRSAAHADALARRRAVLIRVDDYGVTDAQPLEPRDRPFHREHRPARCCRPPRPACSGRARSS